MKNVLKLLGLVWVLVGVSAWAETPAPAPAAPPAASGMNKGTVNTDGSSSIPGPLKPSGYIQALDPNFFNPPSDNKNTPAGLSPKGREFDADPDYNSEQREEWLRKCAPYKDQDSKLFRQCFYREKEKMRLELREKFDSVERRQGGKGKSLQDLIQSNPSSGGFD
ncbi:MAG: hypothetical protein EBQ92_05490 [Proteobacteria bacterium]|nr:hypothetical protein [Pseudomonadota bacterium]